VKKNFACGFLKMYIHKNFAYFLYFSIVNILNSGIIIINIMLFEN